jgi:superfamily II DNA or RNA helicase
MKSKLSNKGYIIIKNEYSDKEIKKIKKELNVAPYSPYQSKFCAPPTFPIYLESKRKLYLPRYWSLDNLGPPEKFCINEGTTINIKFNGSLRPVQEEASSAYIKNCNTNYGGGILCLGCGQGKTALSLYLLSILKKKTLVIVHKEFLLNQWIERIKMFLPDAQVGRIQAKTFDIAGKDIVIGMLQSLSMKDFEENAFDSFGTVIVDEAHHISSEVFSRALPKVSFKYTIGLTATPNRTDGLTKVFEWFLGPIVYRSKGGKQHNVFVKTIQIDDSNETYSKVEEGYDGKPITARMINNVANYIPRTSVIIREVQKIMEESGRKMLILSDRRDHLKYIHTQLTEKGFDVGFYVGGMKQKDLDISETKPIILGTFSMSSEALDIPELNTLFMTTPKSNIEQSVGRILRKTHEIRPLIIDIKDNFRPFANQCNKRKTFYKKCKYEIYEMKVKPSEMEEVLEKNKNMHNITNNIIDDLNETEKSNSKKKGEQIKIDECMFSDDD